MEQLEQIIGYTFQNKKLLRQALTHSSYANEKKLGKLGCNCLLYTSDAADD